MYSENNNLYNYQYDGNDDYSYKNRNKTTDIIIKVILIILCVIALLWLFKLLKGNNNENSNNVLVYDTTLHDNNITKVRLASERYFFLNDNLPEGNNVKTISLQTLINEKLANSIVDGNDNVCNNSKSVISLNRDGSSYLMKINLSCSTDEKEEKFYYDYNTYKCLNCNGNTYMDGTNSKEEDIEQDKESDREYNCNEWSEWQDERENSESLIERTRTVVRGIKKGKSDGNVIYGEWSEYTTTPIKKTDGIEVQVKKVASGKSTRTVTRVETKPSRVVKSCPSGYTLSGDSCYSSVQRGDLNYKEFGTVEVTNKDSVQVKTERNSDGKYELVYKDCTYRQVTKATEKVVAGETTTRNVQVPIENYTLYYRYRTVTKEAISSGDIITDDYYEENKLPEGYEKYPGSEKTQYSYKLTSCVK